MPEAKRRSSHTFRCTEAQWAVIEAAVERSGKSVSDFVVETLLEAVSDDDPVSEGAFTAAEHRSVARAVWTLFRLRAVDLARDGRQADLDRAVAQAKEKFR